VTVPKNEALRIVEGGHLALEELFSQLSDEDFSQRGTMGGGEWSAKDVAAHIGGWYERYMGVGIDAIRRGERPGFADLTVGGEVADDRVNAEIIEEWLAIPAAEVRKRYRNANEGMMEAIRGLSESEWKADVPPVPGSAEQRQSVGDVLGETWGAPDYPFGHAFAHFDDVRAFVEKLEAAE
jgi:hypothetical protein